MVLNLKKKGQGAEMIGLVVIILLLIIIAVIYIKLSSKPEPKLAEAQRVDIQSEQYLYALTRLTICPGNSVEDAMKMCVNDQNSLICGKNSCETAKKQAEITLTALFKEKYEAGLIAFRLQDKLPGEEDASLINGVEASNEYECEQSEIFEKKNVQGQKAYAVLAWCGS